jgi:hypothetical protein
MLTREKRKRGEGQLEALDTEIQRRLHKKEISLPWKLGPFKFEDDFFEAFKLMKAMVEELYHEEVGKGIQKLKKVNLR